MEMDEEKMKEMLRGILNEVLESILPAMLESQLDPLRSSLDFISKGFEDIKSCINNLEKQNKALIKQNKNLSNDVDKLQKELADLRSQVDEQEQYTRRECLELRGVPETARENTDEIVLSVASLLNIGISQQDISVSHRLPKREGRLGDQAAATSGRAQPPAIIVKFTNRNARDRLFKARSGLKNFDISNIGLGRYGNDKIFIQESLTSTKKKLFQKALKFRKEFQFKFIWSQYGVIFLRKHENSRAIRIVSDQDLEQFKNK